MLDDLVVFSVSADPEPHEIASGLDGQRAIMSTDAGGPHPPDCLELYRWMSRIGLEQRKVLVGQSLHGSGQLSVMLPELSRSTVLHSSVVRPSRRSLSASSAR